MPVKPVVAAFLAVLAVAEARAAGGGCSDAATNAPAVRLAGLDAAGDILLDDGRRVRLVGLAARQDEAEAARFAAGIAEWTGKAFSLVPLAGPDRWGRLPARLLAVAEASAGTPVDLAVALLRAGAASRLPEPDHAACDPALRAALGESAALPARRGSPGAEAAVDGHDIAALKAQAGRIVALQGRIASVGERAQRTYLNLSRRRGEAASIVMSRKLWREMQDKGFTAATLPGKRLLARGVLSGQEGLLLEIASVSALDVID
jgi:hypothetical protein